VGRALRFHARDDEIAVIVAIRTMGPSVIAEIMGYRGDIREGNSRGKGACHGKLTANLRDPCLAREKKGPCLLR